MIRIITTDGTSMTWHDLRFLSLTHQGMERRLGLATAWTKNLVSVWKQLTGCLTWSRCATNTWLPVKLDTRGDRSIWIIWTWAELANCVIAQTAERLAYFWLAFITRSSLEWIYFRFQTVHSYYVKCADLISVWNILTESMIKQEISPRIDSLVTDRLQSLEKKGPFSNLTLTDWASTRPTDWLKNQYLILPLRLY